MRFGVIQCGLFLHDGSTEQVPNCENDSVTSRVNITVIHTARTSHSVIIRLRCRQGPKAVSQCLSQWILHVQ